MANGFIIHQHKTGRTHFDIRIVQNGVLRSWSLLKEPPRRQGERRLAIERESFTLDSINSKSFEEEAFGLGNVTPWDQGDAAFEFVSARRLVLDLNGIKVSGKYEFRRMRWYPGNRWLLTKIEN
jgi:DNA ligase D-like protein (predicted 3'-phosphoesterase)